MDEETNLEEMTHGLEWPIRAQKAPCHDRADVFRHIVETGNEAPWVLETGRQTVIIKSAKFDQFYCNDQT